MPRPPGLRRARIEAIVAAGVLALAIGLGLTTLAPRSDAQGGALELRLIGSFNEPTYVAHAPGAASKSLLFVVEKDGAIQVLDHNQPVAHEFLDIRNLLLSGGERGLLSMAFPRNYASSGLFYVYFTNNDGNVEIDEFQVEPGDPTTADPSSRRPLIEIPHPGAASHNGGQVQWGPDDMLWIATGDGGGAGGGDPSENAQNLDRTLGKLLRIDPHPSGANPYTIPANNPFVGAPGRDEIWSYGFRNPWRFSFEHKNLLIADVGQDAWEEVDYETIRGAKGANFGWDNYEGSHLFEGPVLTEHELPIHEYQIGGAAGNCAVMGGYVVRDPSLPTLLGRYVYVDFCVGELRSFIPDFDGAVDDAPLGVFLTRPISFGQGSSGRLYVVTRDGPVYRLVAG